MKSLVLHTLTVSALLVFSSGSIAYAQTSNQVPSPLIGSITRSIGGDGSIYVTGKSIANSKVVIEVISDAKGPVFRDQVTVSGSSEWSIIISDSTFPAGAYTLRAIALNAEGIQSKPTEAKGFKVKPQPLISVKGLEFGWLDVLLLVLFAIITLAGVLAWRLERERRKRDVYATMAERDIANMCTMLSNEVSRLGTLLKDAKGLDPHVSAEAEYLIKNEQVALEKMQGYLSAGVRRLR